MNLTKNKKILFISLFCLDIALTVFLFVISILILTNMPANEIEIQYKEPFLRFFYQNSWSIPVLVVVPLVILLAFNIFVLIMYVRKTGKAKKVKLQDLSAAEKEALRKQLLQDMAKDEKKEDKAE